jgi:GNAT superfamily N-acetyltransferase
MSSFLTLRAPIRLRAKRENDDAFLRYLYETSRDEEFIGVQWNSPEQRAAFFRQQFDAQALHFEHSYERPDYDIIEIEGKAVGRLVLSWEDDHLHCIDLAILPEYRRTHIGSAIMEAIVAEIDRRNISASLFYEKWKPYLEGLYTRYGFTSTKEYDAHVFMQRKKRS